jgi:hypothetical protein
MSFVLPETMFADQDWNIDRADAKSFGYLRPGAHHNNTLKFFVCLPMTQLLAAESALQLLVRKRGAKGPPSLAQNHG